MIGYNKNDAKWFLNPVLKYFKSYSAISPGETLAIAVSGGMDSLVMSYILTMLSKYSWLKINLKAYRVQMDFSEYKQFTDILKYKKCSPVIDPLEVFFDNLGVSYKVLYPEFKEKEPLLESLNSDSADMNQNIRDLNPRVCSICSKIRKGVMAQELKADNIKYLALGHHSNDVAETMLMNICLNRQLKSLYPVVRSDDNSFITLRPMLYLDKQDIRKIHSAKNLIESVDYCPFTKGTTRLLYRQAIDGLKKQLNLPGFAKSVTKAFENPDLDDNWPGLKLKS